MSEGKAYVGSKISLISKSEIRYEGILYTIDPKEATVALAKVRSFGTEDRVTDKPIACQDNVYEYVIFRGKDIKDIKVCEPPQPQVLIGGLPNDPAIVEAYSSHKGYSPTGSFQTAEYGAPAHGMGSETYTLHGAHVGSRPTTPPPKRKSPTMDQGTQVSGSIGVGMRDDRRDIRRSNQMQNQRPLQPSNQQRQGPPQGMQNKQLQQQQQQSNRGGWMRRGGRGARGGGGGGRGSFNKPKEQLKFDGEYDFEQANAEFQEMESKLAKIKINDAIPNGTEPKTEETGTNDETAPPPPPPPVSEVDDETQVSYYDKTKSFFDSISCEALERSKGKFQRTDWRQERKLNVETFGVTNSYMRRGGYRGRGFRGRGGFRGGRSRGGGSGRGMPMGNNMVGNNPNRGIENNGRSNSQNGKSSSQGWVVRV